MSDCWMPIRRMRSKKTANKGATSRKALGSAERAVLPVSVWPRASRVTLEKPLHLSGIQSWLLSFK